MTTFKMRSYRKTAADPAPPTAKTDKSPTPAPVPVVAAPSDGSDGGGVGVPAPIPAGAAPAVTRLPDGRLNAAVLQLQPGRCASCTHWQGPDEYGDGLCPLGRRAHGWYDGNPDAPVMTTPLHECAAHAGRGWKRRR